MSLQNFIANFANAIEVDASTITAETEFKELGSWDSLNALNIIAMVDAEYDVTVSGEDIEAKKSVADLWTFVEAEVAVK